MNTLILMAGRGSRFKDMEIDLPKPLVPLHGEPLVRWVIENLRLGPKQKYIFVCLQEHLEQFKLPELFSKWNIDFDIVVSPTVTEGAACSALLAREMINNQQELIIANSDQYIFYNKPQFLASARPHDGLIMSMQAEGNKWSYIGLDQAGYVEKVKEKVPISHLGTVGIYYFKNGHSFVAAAEQMIMANDRHNNEFYLAPVYNYLIKAGKKIAHFNVGEVGKEMIGLGTSEDFSNFQKNPISLDVAKEIFS